MTKIAKMKSKNYKIDIQILGLDGKIINGAIMIFDGMAISFFDKKGFAKKLYEKNRTPATYYDKIQDGFVEVFPNKDKRQVLEIIKKQLKKNMIKK